MGVIAWQWDGIPPDGAIKRAVFSATKKAGGDAIRRLRAAGKRQVRQRKAIKARFLADRAMPLAFPRAKVLAGLVWRMDVSGSPVPLSEYPHRQVRAGVMVEVNKGKKTLLRGGFLARSRGGKEGVFRRPGKERYPMGFKVGSSVGQTFRDEDLVPEIQGEAMQVFRSSFDRLLQLEIAKIR